jgi:hypothetical protein
VTAIGGTYVLTGEEKVGYQGRLLLVFSGHAVFDTTCCGSGGCAYALVPGFLDGYRCRKDAAGNWLSRVRPIQDAQTRKAVTAVVLAATNAYQVQFL